MKYNIKYIEELRSVAKEVVSQVQNNKLVLFYGEIGAGKTSLIKALCAELKVKDLVNSPTFSIVNEYAYQKDGIKSLIYHIDLFRLEDLDEAINIGIEDYLESDFLCFVEWPQIIQGILPNQYLSVHIKTLEDTSREIEIRRSK